ncbi:MAG: DUF4845 domain-containing protein [Pseudomonadota bacterium]
MVVARSQKGLSLLGWMLLLAVVAFFASAAFKLVPHYMDYMALEKMINSIESEGAQDVRTIGDFQDRIYKGMTINAIDLDLKEALKIKVENNEFQVHLKYEKREPLIRNIDMVVRFDKEFSVRMP